MLCDYWSLGDQETKSQSSFALHLWKQIQFVPYSLGKRKRKPNEEEEEQAEEGEVTEKEKVAEEKWEEKKSRL